MSEMQAVLSMITANEAQLTTLITELRPALLRLCSRMMGSIIDGEDVVQERLVAATSELATLRDHNAMRSWLFRIAYNRSLNAFAARARRVAEPLSDESFTALEPTVDEALSQQQAAAFAIARFVDLPASQRACVVLKDVLDYSLRDIAEMVGLSEMAVKAALHRGRARLATLALEAEVTPPEPSSLVSRYAELFNARDWAGLRALLAEDVRLDLHGREQRHGPAAVGNYFENYAIAAVKEGLQARVAFLDGREVVVVERDGDGYVVVVRGPDERVEELRDYRYAREVLVEARIVGGAYAR